MRADEGDARSRLGESRRPSRIDERKSDVIDVVTRVLRYRHGQQERCSAKCRLCFEVGGDERLHLREGGQAEG